MSTTLNRIHLKLYILSLHKISVLFAGNRQPTMMDENIRAGAVACGRGDKPISGLVIKPLYTAGSTLSGR
jgi:hypothetical protein